MNAAERYFEAACRHDRVAAAATLADDVVMRNPASDDPVVGREAVAAALDAVRPACDEFTHTGLLRPSADGDPRLYGLVFQARIGDKRLEGVDLVRLDDDDRICSFTALARPIASLMALGARMGQGPPRAT